MGTYAPELTVLCIHGSLGTSIALQKEKNHENFVDPPFACFHKMFKSPFLNISPALFTSQNIGNSSVNLSSPSGTPPTPILHSVNSGDIQDNGHVDTRNVTLRWTLSEPDDCSNTINFNVTPDDPTHCGSCEVGPGDLGMQEEFRCQVMQVTGQSCTYRVYAVRCGDTQNGVPSEPVEVNLTGKLGFISRNGIMSEPCPGGMIHVVQ